MTNLTLSLGAAAATIALAEAQENRLKAAYRVPLGEAATDDEILQNWLNGLFASLAAFTEGVEHAAAAAAAAAAVAPLAPVAE